MLKALIQSVPAHIVIIQSRDQFKAKFGVAAPEWDPSQPVKDWLDTRTFTDMDSEVEYIGIRSDSNGNPIYDSNRTVELATFRLFPEVAQSVNLLPEPMPPQGALTPLQLRMSQRKRAWPLELKAGEKVVLSPGIGTIPVIDDGKTVAGVGAVLLSDAQVLLIGERVADAVISKLTKQGFLKPQ